MRTILAQDLKCLPIGRQWQDQRTQVIFNLQSIIEQFPNGMATLVHIKPGQTEPHQIDIVTDLEAGVATWIVDETQLDEQGYGQCQLTYHFDDGRAKTRIWKTFVQTSLVSEGPAPDPIYNWMERFEALTAQTKSNAEFSRVNAIEAKDSADSALQSMRIAQRSKNEAWSYSVHAQTAKDEAKEFSDSAQEFMYAAERYATTASSVAGTVKQYLDATEAFAQQAAASQQQAETYKEQAAQINTEVKGVKEDIEVIKQNVQQIVSTVDAKVDAAQTASDDAKTYKDLSSQSAERAEQSQIKAKTYADGAKLSSDSASSSATSAHTSESLASQYSQEAKAVLNDLHHVAIVDETREDSVLVATYSELLALEQRVRRLQQRI